MKKTLLVLPVLCAVLTFAQNNQSPAQPTPSPTPVPSVAPQQTPSATQEREPQASPTPQAQPSGTPNPNRLELEPVEPEEKEHKITAEEGKELFRSVDE